MVIERKFNALGFYIFAGGFTLGVRKYFNVLGHLESGTFGVETSRRNLHIPIWNKEEEWPITELAGKVDLMYGNPACSGWSLLNVKGRGPKSSSNDGILKMLDVARWIKPKVMVLESVRQLLTGGFDWLKEQSRTLLTHGYHIWPVKVNAADFGVAQIRRRVFFVYSPDVFLPRFYPNDEPATVRDVLSRSITHQKFMEHPDRVFFPMMMQGQSLDQLNLNILERYKPDVAAKRRKNKLFLHWPYRLKLDEPCRVVYSSMKYVHPTEDRILSVGEHAAMMGYPDNFTFHATKKGEELSQIGKAVCPPVAEWMAEQVYQHLESQS